VATICSSVLRANERIPYYFVSRADQNTPPASAIKTAVILLSDKCIGDETTQR
jgi:hypothetical protein